MAFCYKEYRDGLKRRGLCIDCQGPNDLTSYRCSKCRILAVTSAKAKYHGRIASGVCGLCGKYPMVKGIRQCESCRQQSKARYKEHRDERCKQVRDYSRSIKRAVVAGYGGKCVICGENRLPCLELDHINNDGAEHRKEIGMGRKKLILGGSVVGGTKFYRWLIENNCPSNIQILCANCHALKHNKGDLY